MARPAPTRLAEERAGDVREAGVREAEEGGTRTMLREIRQGILFSLVTMALLGGAYPLFLWAIGAVAFRSQAQGSLLRRADGTVIGSRLLAQPFKRPEYFQPRPSGVDYNAASTGGTNFGPSNPDHLKAVRERIDAIRALEGVEPNEIPSELVTASGAGLDPDIPPAAAAIQAARVAAARGAPVERVRALVEAGTESPFLGFIGRPRVNVLALNLALDAAFGSPAPAAPVPRAGAASGLAPATGTTHGTGTTPAPADGQEKP